MAEPLRLLIVCLGNICRSPMAEGLLRARITDSPLTGQVEVDSVGTGHWHVGRPPDPRAIECAAGHGVDISGLRGRLLTSDDYHRFDWLLCADRSVLCDVRELAPLDATARTALLLDWAGLPEGEHEIPDPYSGRTSHFEQVWQLLERATNGTLARAHLEASSRR